MIENRLLTRGHFGFYLRIFLQILKLARRLLSEDVIYCQQVQYYHIEPWFSILTRPCDSFFQDLRSSHGLNEEMKRLAKSIVQQVVLNYEIELKAC